MSLGLPDRIERKISPEPNTGCWLWAGGDAGEGYGASYHNKKVKRAHIVVYELLVGPVPQGLTLDHTCRVRCCVNPDHLEPVTRVVNIMRGEGACAKHARKTHCPQGHEYTRENTQLWKTYRYCKACHNKLTLAAYHRKRGR